MLRDGDKTLAWRVNDKALQKVLLVLGDRDARTGDFAVRSGLKEGDQLIRNPTSSLKDGQKIELAAPVKVAPIGDTASASSDARK